MKGGAKMPKLVLDCSVTMSIVLMDEFDNYATRAYKVSKKGGVLVPSFWRLEVANAFFNAVKSNRLTYSQVEKSYTMIDKIKITTDDGFTSKSIYALMRQYNLTAYDAAYLYLALENDLPLASKDRQLNHAAQLAGVTLFT